MLFCKRCTRWKHLRGIGLVPMDAACWVSWGKGIETPYSTGSSLRPLSMHCLLSFIFITFLILGLCVLLLLVSRYRSCLVCSGLAYEIYSGGGPSMYIYCVVSYCVTVAPYVRSVGHVFAYLYTFNDDSERTMDYETSLLPKFFLGCGNTYLLSSNKYLLKVVIMICG